MFCFIATHKIKVAAIGRKRDSDVTRGGGSDDLRVASSLDVAELKRLQTVFVEHERQIFSVGRNGGESGVAVVREIFDGETLEGKVHGLVRKGESKNAVACGEQNGEGEENRDAGAELIFLRGFDQRGAAAWRGRNRFESRDRRGRKR